MLRAGTGRRGPFSGALVSPTAAAISCAFPLTYTGLGAFGLLEPTVSADGQTITQALTSGTNEWAAASFTQTVPANSGATVIRLRIDALPAMAANASEGASSVKLALYSAGPADVFTIGILATSSGTYAWQTSGSGQAPGGGALASLPAFVDVHLRSADSMVDVALPDGTVLVQDLPYNVGTLNPLLSITGSSVATTGIGKTVSCSMVTSATALADSPFAGNGCKDSCGNVLADPHFASVFSLLHFDGAVGAAGLTDEKGVTWTVTGTTPELTAAQKQFGPTSLLMGSGTYLSATSPVDIGTGDFVLEGWFYEQGARAFIQIGNYLLYHSSGSYHLWNGSSNLISLPGSTTNSWVYAALVRVGGRIHFHINSTKSNTVVDVTNFGTPTIKLGYYNAGNPSPLYIDEFRATYGTDRLITGKPGGQFPDN